MQMLSDFVTAVIPIAAIAISVHFILVVLDTPEKKKRRENSSHSGGGSDSGIDIGDI